MAAATDELILLERVFLRLGAAETDEQLQAAVCKFLPPVLLKLSSTQEGVRKKVMELLIHINKRIKSRPQIQLPVETLLVQYQDPSASSFVINFTIIYIKLGFPRMDISNQAKLVPSMLHAIEGKPLSHQDSLLLLIIPALGHINAPLDAEKRASLLGLQDKPHISKQLLNFMLDVLILPYGSVLQATNEQPDRAMDWSPLCIPCGLSEYAYKRIMAESPLTAEQLEQMKLGIIKFLAMGFFPDSDILIHLIVGAADTRFSVANLADLELKKIVNTLDWSSMQLAAPLYALFLGTEAQQGFYQKMPFKEGAQKKIKPEMKRLPACIRIRLKLLHYLCRVTKAGFIIPACIQVVFHSLKEEDGQSTNVKLKSLALQFTSNIVQHCSLVPLSRIAGIILDGMMKLIFGSDNTHKGMAYIVLGQLGRRIPSVINRNTNLLCHLFDTLVWTDGDLQRTVRDTLISLTSAFVLEKDDKTNISLMNELLSTYIESPESNVRFVAMHYVANIFPADDAPSRYLLLLASGDEKHEISTEAKKVLYGNQRKEVGQEQDYDKLLLPDFESLVSHVYSKMKKKMSTGNNEKSNVESKVVPYNNVIIAQITAYLRICLSKSSNVTTCNEPLEHPCESTPLIVRYLQSLHSTGIEKQSDVLQNYFEMILAFSHACPDQVSLQALLEIVVSIPDYGEKLYKQDGKWLRTLYMSTKIDVRHIAAKIYGIIASKLPNQEFESQISEIVSNVDKKNLEMQHGSLLTLTYMMERRLILVRDSMDDQRFNWDLYADVVKKICTFLRSNMILLMDAAIQSIGILGKIYGLPLPDDGEDESNKKAIVESLFSTLNNVKFNTKVKEKAAHSLGYLCIGENFPHTSYIVNKIIASVKETKDIEIHLILGETLVCCVQGDASPEKRDAWAILPEEYTVPYSNSSTQLLICTLDELLRIYKDPHPNLRQAICIWLLALLKHNIHRECVKEKFSSMHSAFMDFLPDNNDIVQDMASKALSLMYIHSSKEEREYLVSNILNQFTQGRKTVQQVTPDTKLFEEGEFGKLPTTGNLSTYKEICSLATELQKPDLVYYFMHLANHNAVWTSKKGAAFGFAAIAKIVNEELNKYLPVIIPHLYRYQFDPTPKIQNSMSSIWHTIVPSTTKAVEQYHKEIMDDIINNITHHEWRVRFSCCNALADLLRMNVPLDLAQCAPELLKKLFRVMDDIHEGTRLAATNTTKTLSKVCIRYCDSSQGKEGEKVLQSILPVLLDIGVTNVVRSVRAVSLQTVSQLVSKAGLLLKPFLITLIPALLTTIGESENPNYSYLSNICEATSEARDAIDNIRASAAKEHYAAETMTKCIQYVDAEILKELMPKVIELVKSSVGFGTKITSVHFIILLSTHCKHELHPYSGKIISALMHGLSDRNSVVKKYTAAAIGHVVGSAKESTLEKLFKTLNSWYMERDDATKLTIGHTLQAINTYNQDILRNYSDIVIPLTFFAMHLQKTQENQALVDLWTDLWNEITPGTEAGIRQNLEPITDILRTSLQSSSWSAKAQAANAVHTLAEKLGSNVDTTVKNNLLMVLADGLRGRTWDGKDRLLKALATLACNSKDVLKENNEICENIIQILQRESKKEAFDYRRHALEALGTVLHQLDIDKFKEVYDIVQEILTMLPKKNDGESSVFEERMKRNNEIIKLYETVYEVLGKVWPSSKETQDKYCVEFINHYSTTFPTQTTTIQISMLSTLNLYVDKLVLLKINSTELSDWEKEMLNTVCDTLNKILKYSIGITYTKIRKETLNIALSLGKKLRATNNNELFEKIIIVIREALPELTKDSEPEIRTRIIDVKEMLKI